MKVFLLLLLLLAAVPLRAETKTPPASPSAALGLPSASAVAVEPVGPRSEIEALWADGKKKEAKKRLEKWMDEEKSSPWPWVMAAKIQCAENKFKKCASLADVALIKSVDCPEAYYWKGRGLEGQDKTLDAANEYRAALTGPNKFSDAQKDLDRLMPTLGQ